MDEWAERVAAWQRSGHSAVVFCRARGWDPAQLRWWRWKLERRDAHGGLTGPAASPARAVAEPTFLRLVAAQQDDRRDPVAPYGVAARCELVLRDGRVLRFDDQVAPSRLRALADALEIGS
jgi:hypothetical protein